MVVHVSTLAARLLIVSVARERLPPALAGAASTPVMLSSVLIDQDFQIIV